MSLWPAVQLCEVTPRSDAVTEHDTLVSVSPRPTSSRPWDYEVIRSDGNIRGLENTRAGVDAGPLSLEDTHWDHHTGRGHATRCSHLESQY